MRLVRLGLALAVTLALAWPSPGAQTTAADRHPFARNPGVAAALTVLDAWIGATIAQREQPGLSIGIVYDQDLIWAKGYGFADLERRLPATPSTLYRIASISKLFTATAVMQLRDAGKLRLDDPVSDRLPWFSIKMNYEGGPPITVRQLLTHTSGLPREVRGANFRDLTFPSRDEMRQVLAGQETISPPDTEFAYSSLGASVAGEIVTELSGESWSQYVERHIFQPLGMTASRAAPVGDMPGLAVGYQRRGPGRRRDPEPFVDVGAEAPAGNLASNVEDMAQFVSLQFRDGSAGGAQILRGSTLREMHRVHWLHPDWQSGRGLGFSVRRVGDQARIGHSGSLAGYTSYVEFVPGQKLGVIVLTNADAGAAVRYVDQAFTLLSPAVARAVALPDSSRVADPAWRRYVGRYAWKFAEVQILILNGELTMITPDADNPWTSRLILKPVGPNTLRIVASGLRGEPVGDIGELLTFEMDAKDKVARVRTPYRYWLPIE